MGSKILLVEDEPLARKNIAAVLEKAQYSVQQAESGEAALDLMASAAFDTVISDFQLPGRITGIDVLRRHHIISPGKQLILITAFGSEEVQRAARAIGALYMEKPFLVTTLLSKIQMRSLT